MSDVSPFLGVMWMCFHADGQAVSHTNLCKVLQKQFAPIALPNKQAVWSHSNLQKGFAVQRHACKYYDWWAGVGHHTEAKSSP